jgi:hypothetical protein
MVAEEEPMRIAIIAVASLFISACSVHDRNAERARTICQTNGNPVGSAEFNRCFDNAFGSMTRASRPAAALLLR